MLIFYLRVLDCLKHAGGCEDLSYNYCGSISTVVAFDLFSATFDPPRLPGASLNVNLASHDPDLCQLTSKMS